MGRRHHHQAGRDSPREQGLREIMDALVLGACTVLGGLAAVTQQQG